jgi:peptidoglycan/xylan/chitin deacetylase (PgdA/CDA1 family)
MIWIKIKYRVRLLFQIFTFKIGFGKFLLKNRYGERILVFHGVARKSKNQFNSRFVSVTYFEKFIQYITTHFNVVSLDDYYAGKLKKGTLNIAITFDDGYANNYEYAVPILEKYNVPASFYITTIHDKSNYLWADYIDLVSFFTPKKTINFDGIQFTKNKKSEFMSNGISLKSILKTLPYEKIKLIYPIFEDDWIEIQKKDLKDYWQLMSLEQANEINKKNLFTIGAHSFTHSNLTKITLEEAKKEILQSKNILERVCKQNIEEFAFPFGFYTNELIDYCTEVGFKKILLVDYNTPEEKNNEFTINRFVINPYVSLENQIAYLLRGTYY